MRERKLLGQIIDFVCDNPGITYQELLNSLADKGEDYVAAAQHNRCTLSHLCTKVA